MTAEVWKPISGFGGVYEVSSAGRVRSYKNNKWGLSREPRIISGQLGKHYRTVALCDGGQVKTCYIHRLVAEAFVPKVPGADEVNHKDGNKMNCAAENLEWVTHGGNVAHAFRTGLIPTKVKTVCIETGETFDSVTASARSEKVTQAYMSTAIKLKKAIHGRHYEKIGGNNREHL